MANVLLINPPSDAANPVFPFGLGSIAAMFIKEGIEIDIIDAWGERLSHEQLEARIADLKPAVIGITMMSPVLLSGMETVSVARKAAPDSTVVVGGAHPSALPQECLEDNPQIDIVVIGEGENTLLEIVHALDDGEELDDIAGIVFRKNGKTVVTAPRAPIADIDSLPLPAYNLFPMEKYKTHPPYGRKTPYVNMITSRGCPFHCTYCSNSVFGRKMRLQSPEKILSEMEFLIGKYHIKEIHFYDDCFTLNKKRTRTICEEILRRKMKVIWSCTTRVDLVDEELLKLMRKAGCWLIAYGVESGSPKILKEMEKGVTVEQIEKSFKLTRKAGIRTLGYFMLGMPGETKETIQETIDVCFKIDPDYIAWGMLRIFPGSKIYNSFKEKDLNSDETYSYSSLKGASTNMPFGETGFLSPARRVFQKTSCVR